MKSIEQEVIDYILNVLKSNHNNYGYFFKGQNVQDLEHAWKDCLYMLLIENNCNDATKLIEFAYRYRCKDVFPTPKDFVIAFLGKDLEQPSIGFVKSVVLAIRSNREYNRNSRVLLTHRNANYPEATWEFCEVVEKLLPDHFSRMTNDDEAKNALESAYREVQLNFLDLKEKLVESNFLTFNELKKLALEKQNQKDDELAKSSLSDLKKHLGTQPYTPEEKIAKASPDELKKVEFHKYLINKMLERGVNRAEALRQLNLFQQRPEYAESLQKFVYKPKSNGHISSYL